MAASLASTTRLIVLRGNSGSGNSTTVHALRARLPGRFAWIEQDYLRRIVLQEDGAAERPVTSGLIEESVHSAMAQGIDVILDGILNARRYVEMLRRLSVRYPPTSTFYYFSVPFEETVRRHETRPIANDFGEDELRAWYRDSDPLPSVSEPVILASASLDETVDRILGETGMPPDE